MAAFSKNAAAARKPVFEPVAPVVPAEVINPEVQNIIPTIIPGAHVMKECSTENLRFESGSDDCGCHDRLECRKLCAKCAKICFLKSKKEWVEDLAANNICAQDIMSFNAGFDNLSANRLCASDATINNLCVTNLNAPNFALCNTNRAYLGLTAAYTYTLGSNLAFDDILDDPSSMASQLPTTHFTAPVAGYYDINLFVNASALTGANIVVGLPVASLSIQVNGISRTSILTPFLAFSPSITDTLTASLLLQVGDQVTGVLNVLVQDPVLGAQNYVGTMLISGGPLGLTVDPSTFNLSLLSTLCGVGPTPPACIPCAPVEIPCPRVDVDGCNPCM